MNIKAQDNLVKVTKNDAKTSTLPDPFNRNVVNMLLPTPEIPAAWLRSNSIDMDHYKQSHEWMLNKTKMINSIPNKLPSSSPLLNLDSLALMISEGVIDHVDYYGPNGTIVSVFFNTTDQVQAAVNIKARLEVALGGSLSDPSGKIAAQLQSVVGPLVAVSVAPSNSEDRAIVPDHIVQQLHNNVLHSSSNSK